LAFVSWTTETTNKTTTNRWQNLYVDAMPANGAILGCGMLPHRPSLSPVLRTFWKVSVGFFLVFFVFLGFCLFSFSFFLFFLSSVF
jgi:hypothetical protein